MKFLDKILQIWRIAKAKPFVPWGARVLDVGGYNGALLNLLPVDRLSCGIDPKAPPESRRMIPGCFPKDMPDVAPFDAITMLACLEHVPNEQLNEIKAGCAKFLKRGGRLIITVPSPLVDRILTVLKALHMIDGLSFEEHHGYRVSMTEEIFDSPTFHLAFRCRFQLGLNNLFVFIRS